MSLALKQSPNARFPDNLPPTWRDLLSEEQTKAYFLKLTQFLKAQYQAGKTIYPPKDKILAALQMTDFKDVRVVVLGQDPYHGPGQAIGRSFAVPNELRVKPPSLVNIFKELESDLGIHWDRKSSDLSDWSRQGVLLLNAVLTVERGRAHSHKNQGWEIFTDRVIELLNARDEPVIFLLWGSAAQKKAQIVDPKKHFILKSVHPSPLSAHRGFFGCKHFSKTNEILEQKLNRTPIEWARICDE